MNNFYVYVYLDSNDIPFYVGKGKGYRHRISGHLTKQPFLKNKIHTIGAKNIKIEFPLKNVSEEDALAYEELFIGIVGRRDQGKGPLVNLTDGGKANSGYIPSKEWFKKQRESHLGQPSGNKGNKYSAESKRKISEARRGSKRSKETKQKISKATKGENNPMYGRHLSEEAKHKVSEANKDRKRSEEFKKNVSRFHKGKKLSKETRRKISETKKKKRKQSIKETKK